MDPVVFHNFLVDMRAMIGAELDEAIAKLCAPPSRDQLAMAAMQGLLSFPYHESFQFPPPAHDDPKNVAQHAYALADAMLVERAKPVAP